MLPLLNLSWFTGTSAKGTRKIQQKGLLSVVHRLEWLLVSGTIWSEGYCTECKCPLSLIQPCNIYTPHPHWITFSHFIKLCWIQAKAWAHSNIACSKFSLEVVFGDGKVQTLGNSIWICLCPSLLPPVAHHQLRNDFNRDGGEGNENQPQSKHSTSLNTCFGLLVPWEKTHWGCTLAHKCPVCLVHSPQTTIAKCLSGHEEAWVGLFKNLEICLSYLSVIQLQVAVGQMLCLQCFYNFERLGPLFNISINVMST